MPSSQTAAVTHQPDSSTLVDVQAVINSYGREAWYIERSVASLLRQKYRPHKIHFIDQNDLPLTLDPEIERHPDFLHHHNPTRCGALARNTVLNMIKTGWIAFNDDDSHWVEDYSEHLNDILSTQRGLGLIAGSMIDETTGKYYTLRHQWGGDLSGFLGSKLLYGANFLVRAEIFKKVKGYDSRLGPGTCWPSSEEADLCWRIITAGTKSLYARELAILHPSMHSSDTNAATQKGFSYGRGKGALAAIWLFEKHHYFGLLEFLEMSTVPIINMIRGALRGNWGQVRIQMAVLRGRQTGFWSYALKRNPQ
jgi:hypothetical protein